MGAMVEAGGYKDVKELGQKMKQGKVGMPELIKFIAIMEKRSKESGAYEKGRNTLTSYESRMGTARRDFAIALAPFYEGQLKTTFGTITLSLEKMAEALNILKADQNRTGIVGEFQTAIDFSMEMVRMLGETLQLSIEGLWELYKFVTNSSQGSLKQFLADRQVERQYFKEKGITSEMGKEQARNEGMVGYGKVAYDAYKRVGASDNEAYLLANADMERLGLNKVPLTGTQKIDQFVSSGLIAPLSFMQPTLGGMVMGMLYHHYAVPQQGNVNTGIPYSLSNIFANPTASPIGQGTTTNNYVTIPIDGSKSAWEIANAVEDILNSVSNKH